jgi:hypothetical protein
MVQRGAALSAVWLAIGLAGCGGSSGSPGAPADGGGNAGSSGGGSMLGAHGCTSIEVSCLSNAGSLAPSCEEQGGYGAATVARFMSNCQHPNQVFSTNPCDHTGAIGACVIAVNGSCAATWAYGTVVTASDLQTSCTGAHGTFVAP